MAGMALLTLNEALRPAPGDIICLLVPTFYAVDLMVTEKAVAKPEVDPIALGVLQTAVAGVVMLGLALLLETPSPARLAQRSGRRRCSSALFCSGICFVIQSVEQQFTTASHASLIFTLEPVFSAVFAYFLLSERLTVRGYFGAALMLVSLLIMELDVPALLKKDEKKRRKNGPCHVWLRKFQRGMVALRTEICYARAIKTDGGTRYDIRRKAADAAPLPAACRRSSWPKYLRCRARRSASGKTATPHRTSTGSARSVLTSA